MLCFCVFNRVVALRYKCATHCAMKISTVLNSRRALLYCELKSDKAILATFMDGFRFDG